MGATIGKILTTPDLVYCAGELHELRAAVRDALKSRVDIIAICSGDGLLSLTLTVLREEMKNLKIRTPPLIWHLPLGTMRVVADELDIKDMDVMTFAGYVAGQMRLGKDLKLRRLHPLNVNGRLGFVCGTAFLMNVLDLYYLEEERGVKRVLEVGALTLADELRALLTLRKSRELLTKPVHARVTIPGNDPLYCPHHEHTILMCGSVTQVGMGCKGLPDALAEPGKFMFRSSQMSFWQYVFNALPLVLGVRDLPNTFNAVTNELIVDFAEKTGYTVDGDLFDPVQRLHIRSDDPFDFVVG